MTGRTIIIFSLFIAVVIVASTFMLLYRDQVDRLLAQYVSNIAVCGNITDENICFEHVTCEGIYGPSCPDCDDNTFLRCQRVSADQQAVRTSQRTMCVETGGSWYQNKRGTFCLCGDATKGLTFDPQRGCVQK